jgi:hypothetical protein
MKGDTAFDLKLSSQSLSLPRTVISQVENASILGVSLIYTGGAAGGFPRLTVQWRAQRGAGVTSNTHTGVLRSGALLLLEQYDLTACLGGGTTTLMFDIAVPTGAADSRLLWTEGGAPATPGSITVATATTMVPR